MVIQLSYDFSLRCKKFDYNMLREYLDIRRPKKQEGGEACIMRILTISTLNADRVEVD
jgi:hypothetical protein